MDTRHKEVKTLLNAVTSTQTSGACQIAAAPRTIQASVTGTGAVTATVLWYGNNLNANSGGELFATTELSGTTTDHSGKVEPAEWPYVYADLTVISGTGAAVTATIGY